MSQESDVTMLREKLAHNEEERLARRTILRGLDTKRLIESLPALEEALEKAMRDDARFRDLNSGYLASQGSDCAEVKRLLAIMAPQAEGKNAAEREAWVTKMRTADPELDATINRQKTVAFNLENNRISIEMARKKLENIRTILALKTAQIEFLTLR